MLNIITPIYKYKKTLIVLACFIPLLFSIKYFYKKKNRTYIQPKTELHEKTLFDQSLKKAQSIDTNYWDEKYNNIIVKDKYKVIYIAGNDFGGDKSYAEFFKFAAEKIGWKVKIYNDNALGREDEILEFDPDFIISGALLASNLDESIYGHRSKKYVLSLSPFEVLRHWDFFKKDDPYIITRPEFEKNLNRSNGILSTSLELDVYQTMFTRIKKPFNGIFILPLAPKFENNPVEPLSISWFGGNWDHLRSSKSYKNFINLVSQNLPFKAYGRKNSYQYLASEIYDGYIPNSIQVIDAIRKNGIYLLTHSNIHIETATPSLRIFEATAANAVVISDRHPFAIEHFGDNFLYFDQTADAETMYKQVKAHYDWIKANPEKAKAMAARAHQIFLDKFTLEKDLVRIAKMHEYVVKQEKEMGLSYPLAY